MEYVLLLMCAGMNLLAPVKVKETDLVFHINIRFTFSLR